MENDEGWKIRPRVGLRWSSEYAVSQAENDILEASIEVPCSGCVIMVEGEQRVVCTILDMLTRKVVCMPE